MCKLTEKQYVQARFKGHAVTSTKIEYRVVRRNRHYKWYVKEKEKEEWKHVPTKKVPKSKFVEGTFTDLKAKIKVSFEKPPGKKRKWHNYGRDSPIPAVFKRLLQPGVNRKKTRTAGRAPPSPPIVYEVNYRTRSGGASTIQIYNYTNARLYVGLYTHVSFWNLGYDPKGDLTNTFVIQPWTIGKVDIEFKSIGTIKGRFMVITSQADALDQRTSRRNRKLDVHPSIYEAFPVSSIFNRDIVVYPVDEAESPLKRLSNDVKDYKMETAKKFSDLRTKLDDLNGGKSPGDPSSTSTTTSSTLTTSSSSYSPQPSWITTSDS